MRIERSRKSPFPKRSNTFSAFSPAEKSIALSIPNLFRACARCWPALRTWIDLRAALILLGIALPAQGSTLVSPPVSHTLGFDRVTGRELAFVLPGTKIVSPAGIAVGRLRVNESTSEADAVTVVAIDSGSGLVLSNGRGVKGLVWSGKGAKLGALNHPADVALDADGRVAVTDPGNRRVLLLHHDGANLTAQKEFKNFQDPRGIAADGRGGFYVCDQGANGVIHLDTRTGERSLFGLEISFDRPIAIAAIPDGERLAKGKKRRIAVADRAGARLRLFTVEGNLIASQDARAMPGSSALFQDIDFDYFANVFAVDALHHKIHKLRDDLLPLDSFGAQDASKPFRSPRGIAIRRALGQVFITEEDGGRYLWVGTDVLGFEAQAKGGEVALSYVLTEESTASLRILDASGRLVTTIFSDDRQSPGAALGAWDGTADDGAVVPSGEYVAEIRARATYSSRSTFEKRLSQRFRWERRK
jgi:hypothetical protein